MTNAKSIPSVSVSYARTGRTIRSNELGMRPMQERAWEKRGEQYLLIKSPPASGKSRALMFVALDKLTNQGVRQAVIVAWAVARSSIVLAHLTHLLSRSVFAKRHSNR